MQNAFIAQLLAKEAKSRPAATPDIEAPPEPTPHHDDENLEMHDSAFFDVTVEIIFHGFPQGPAPLRIPQQSTPPGWKAEF